MNVRYEKLKEIYEHLNREHNLPQSCYAMNQLGKLWGRGAEEAVARNEKRQKSK